MKGQEKVCLIIVVIRLISNCGKGIAIDEGAYRYNVLI